MNTAVSKALVHSAGFSQGLKPLTRLVGGACRLFARAGDSHCLHQAGTLLPLCRLLRRSKAGRKACAKFMESCGQELCKKPFPFARTCFAGLTEVVIPVMVAGCPVAWITCGQFLRGRNSVRNQNAILSQVAGSRGGARMQQAARRALSQTPRLSRSQIQACLALAELLVENFSHSSAAAPPDGTIDPPCVAHAKAYVGSHLTDACHTRDAAQEEHLSEPYLCRRFKAATGMTFSEYVARCRVERAKELLRDPGRRVTEIAFSIGFQSLPHFNRTFKRFTRRSPCQYRQALLAAGG